MDPVVDEVLRALSRRPGAAEPCHVRTFTFYHRGADGQPREVRVELYDAGPDVNPLLRYYARATTEDGRWATGHNADSPSGALSIVHWNELDMDPPEEGPRLAPGDPRLPPSEGTDRN